MMGDFQEMLDQIDPDDATELRAFQDFLRVVKINKAIRKRLAEAEAKPATLRLIANWKEKRAQHNRVGLPNEVIRVLAGDADEVLKEWPNVDASVKETQPNPR